MVVKDRRSITTIQRENDTLFTAGRLDPEKSGTQAALATDASALPRSC